MTKKGRYPGFGLYFMAIILLLAAYYMFYGPMGTSSITYSQVQNLFQQEQVESFYVKDGDSLYLNLKSGATVRNELESTDAFRADLGELIAAQKAKGVLKDYDYAPTYSQ